MTGSTTRPAPSSSRRIRSNISASSSSTPASGARRPMASTERPPPHAAAKIVDIFTDGACSGNPGPGGWGALLRYDGHEREILGGHPANERADRLARRGLAESRDGVVPGGADEKGPVKRALRRRSEPE